MQKKILLISFALLLALILSGCASAPDVPVCVEINPARGYCVHTLSDKEYYVDDTNLLEGKTWWQHRPTMVQVPVTSWEKIKSFVIKSCRQSKACQKQVGSWERRVDAIDSEVQEKQR